MRTDISWVGVLLLLASCGSESNSVDGKDVSAAETSDTFPESKMVAEPAVEKPEVNCKTVKGQTAPKGQPADDILGIRQGMTLDQARSILQCKNASYAINTNESSVGLPSGGRMSRIDLSADSGLDKVNVWLVGPSGKEQVIHVDRMTEYVSGKKLPVSSIKQELVEKYGQFGEASYGNSGVIARSRDGQQLSPGNSSYSTCQQHNFNSSAPNPCLNVVSYQVRSDSQNPELASRFSVSITNHAKSWAMVQAAEEKKSEDVERARAAAEDGGLEL